MIFISDEAEKFGGIQDFCPLKFGLWAAIKISVEQKIKLLCTSLSISDETKK